MKLENKISDILNGLSINDDQLANYQDQWARGEYYLEYVNYKGREIKINDVIDMIMEAFNDVIN